MDTSNCNVASNAIDDKSTCIISINANQWIECLYLILDVFQSILLSFLVNSDLLIHSKILMDSNDFQSFSMTAAPSNSNPKTNSSQANSSKPNGTSSEIITDESHFFDSTTNSKQKQNNSANNNKTDSALTTATSSNSISMKDVSSLPMNEILFMSEYIAIQIFRNIPSKSVKIPTILSYGGYYQYSTTYHNSL